MVSRDTTPTLRILISSFLALTGVDGLRVQAPRLLARALPHCAGIRTLQVRQSHAHGEDVAGNGKPGWIADTPGAALAFTVRV